MNILTHLLLIGMSFCLAHYNKKENDKFGIWIWNISGVLWSLNVAKDIIEMICQ